MMVKDKMGSWTIDPLHETLVQVHASQALLLMCVCVCVCITIEGERMDWKWHRARQSVLAIKPYLWDI